MKKISEYDERQLRLMYENLISFDMKQNKLGTLVGCLEFLLNTLESNDEKWDENILNEITILETINALEIINDSGDEFIDIDNEKKDISIKNSINNLKELIKVRLG